MKTIIALIFVLSFNTLAFADSPPCWCEFEVKSENKKFIAKVTMNENDFRKEKYEARWILTIYKDSVSDSTVFWTTDYEFDGYEAGEISNDGKVFAYVDDWYYENFNIVKIYNQGKKVADFDGKEFNIPTKKLLTTVSHHLWKSNINNSVYFEYTNQDVTLVIHTIDNKTHKIDCLKGVFR